MTCDARQFSAAFFVKLEHAGVTCKRKEKAGNIFHEQFTVSKSGAYRLRELLNETAAEGRWVVASTESVDGRWSAIAASVELAEEIVRLTALIENDNGKPETRDAVGEGMVIAVLGSDGSGKSTLLQLLHPSLEALFKEVQ